jgi:fumarate reductase flavoprotein subunit
MYFIGVNPITELIPVRPTQHYSMGGIRVNKDGHAYNLEGLFALGEVACWDMHGFNRLGGNSLAETVVAGMVVGKEIANYTKKATLRADKTLAEQFAKKEQDKIAKMLNNPDGENVYKLRDEIANMLNKHVHIFRTEEGLTKGAEGLLEIVKRTKNVKVQSHAPGMNPELSSALRIEGMAKQAYLIAKGGLDRTESRGAHSREDYPKRDDDKWLNRTLARWPDLDGEPVFTYESVGLLDLPPGYRGYGDDLRVDMTISTEEYNNNIHGEQKRHGRIETSEPIGARLPKEIWKSELKETK